MFNQNYIHAVEVSTVLMTSFEDLSFTVDRYSNKFEYSNHARIILQLKDKDSHIQIHVSGKGYEVWCDTINPYKPSGDYNDVVKDKDNLLEYLYHLVSLLSEA